MTAFDATDHAHMARALQLAERGLFTTQPNPRVGCVIAQGAEVVGSGWHRRRGEPHAEIHALREAGERARAASAYVTLEPCAHHGCTPPCTDALLAAGVARVVIAVEDPFPEVAGRGVAKLRGAGVTVETGLLHDAARELNRGFFRRIEHSRPWVRLKLATSLDGRSALANGQSRWITGEASRADVQRWRARSSAILTGSGTAAADDPRLTVRFDCADFVPPLRVVFDAHLAGMRDDAHLLDGSVPTLVFHSASAQPAHAGYARVECVGIAASAGRLDPVAALTELAARGINELQVEAGPTLAGALFADGLVDEVLWYIAPTLLGDRARPALALPALTGIASCWRLEMVEQRQVGTDLRLLLRQAPAR
ncbi:MAG TPA: bifunctional diaminohydroxyphosphoribosylaminopyrimidine deaminase/5-amino-6-(5-phosphoribosylamino)uracil reductase RibD [Rhodanobacteraceae bacterium]|nr:bifunctional diaminohydroxyphosphoribosylaminopyrimidine deaminase/5-amino-6-(5-phosphoribosylamino)uracil reductase RibD [Rhodanobacteraceae bacterium]